MQLRTVSRPSWAGVLSESSATLLGGTPNRPATGRRLRRIRLDPPAHGAEDGLVIESTANELVGRLTLADAMLGEVVTDMRRILAHANWPAIAREPGMGLTTGSAARKLETELGHEAALDTDALTTWVADVKDVVRRRDRVVHAIALDQCLNCGDATKFRHPRSGEDVDRGPEAEAAIDKSYSDLRAQGLPLATELSKAVNDRILVEANRIANETDEIQNPPQIYPHHVEHLCAACKGGERGQTTVHVGTAIAVIPTARRDEFQADCWPRRDDRST
jgi:hypothetical protein